MTPQSFHKACEWVKSVDRVVVRVPLLGPCKNLDLFHRFATASGHSGRDLWMRATPSNRWDICVAKVNVEETICLNTLGWTVLISAFRQDRILGLFHLYRSYSSPQ